MSKVVFQTSGILDLRAITMFGCSSKPRVSSPIGHFGTGLKYALAILAREGCKVEIYRDKDKPLKLDVLDTIFRDKALSAIKLGDHELPFTTDLGKQWELWQALREIESNTRDEGGHSFCTDESEGLDSSGKTLIVIEDEAFSELYDDLDDIFLNTDGLDISRDSAVEIFYKPSDYLYYKGIRVYKYNKPAMFTYNITNHMELTEDRTISYWFNAERIIAQALGNLDNENALKDILYTSDTMESSLDFADSYNSVRPSETFSSISSGKKVVNSSAVQLVKNIEKPKEDDEPTVEDRIAELVTELCEIICSSIEEPAGYGCGYGITIDGQTDMEKAIQDFVENKIQ